MAVIQLDVADDQVLIERTQSREGGKIARLELARDLVIQRRRQRIPDLADGVVRAAAGEAPVFVPNAVADRLAEIRGKSAGIGEIEAAEARQHPRDRILHDVRSVSGRTHPAWQASVRDPPQTWKGSRDELSERARIPEPGTEEELPGSGGRGLAERHAAPDRADNSARRNNLYVLETANKDVYIRW